VGKSVEYLAVGITAIFWTLSTTTNLKFCLPNFVFQFHTRQVWSLLVSMGPTRVSGYVDMKFPQTFMEAGLNSIRTTHVIKIIAFLKRKRVHQPESEFLIISTIIFKYAKCSNKFQR